MTFKPASTSRTVDIKLIISDRDGVINEDSDNYIKSPEEWLPIPGSILAISRLKIPRLHYCHSDQPVRRKQRTA